jgi:tRNA A37 N6-isopentenylltransferase MiaA
VHNPRKEKTLQRDQTVYEMVEEVLARQAKSLADRTGQPFERALEVVAATEAGRQLSELASGEHRYEKAHDWQVSVLWERAEERLMHLIASDALSRFVADRHYSWVEGYMEWLEGKEARAQYHALLEEELASLRG